MQLSLFDRPPAPKPAPKPAQSNDYHLLPASPKQLDFARRIAQRIRRPLPDEVQADRSRLSAWIDENKRRMPVSRFSDYPSSRQVAFAERLARIKHRDLPPECFRDKAIMSKWIDANR